MQRSTNSTTLSVKENVSFTKVIEDHNAGKKYVKRKRASSVEQRTQSTSNMSALWGLITKETNEQTTVTACHVSESDSEEVEIKSAGTNIQHSAKSTTLSVQGNVSLTKEMEDHIAGRRYIKRKRTSSAKQQTQSTSNTAALWGLITKKTYQQTPVTASHESESNSEEEEIKSTGQCRLLAAPIADLSPVNKQSSR